MRWTRSNDGLRRATIVVKHRIGSREIAMGLFLSDGGELGEQPTEAQVIDLIRRVARQSGRDRLWPQCGADIETGCEAEYAPAARWAAATVRRLWPELDDADLAQFERDYAMPGIDLTEGPQ